MVMRECRQEIEVLHKAPKKPVRKPAHNNTQKMDGSFVKERALSFKAVQTVEIKMEVVEDQRLNSKRGVIHVHTQVNQ